MKGTYSIFVFCVVFMAYACSKVEKSENFNRNTLQHLPELVKNLDSLTVYSTETLAPDTVVLVREQVFESNEDVYFDGYLGDAVVDDENRVYINVFRPGYSKIYVMNPDGSILTTLGRPGRGPGEFLAISGMVIRDDRLYVYDPIQFKISVFSLRDFTHVKDMIVTKAQVTDEPELLKLSAKGEFFVKEDSTFLMGFKTADLEAVYEDTMKPYYNINEEGRVQPGKVLELKRHRYYPPADKHGARMPGVMPFENKSIIRAYNNRLYVLWTENVLIKEYDWQGTYQRAFYKPYAKEPLYIYNIGLGERRLEIAEHNENLVPKNWPAVHTFEIDDEGRFWVFTITDSDSTYKGWVLDQKGELMARFDWPGERVSRRLMSNPVIVIKNGYLYTDEENDEGNNDRIVKYKINFKSQ